MAQNQRQQKRGGNREQQSRTGDPDLKDRLVGINRVAKTTKGGRTFSFSAIVIVGDEKGRVGHGLGKSREVATAIQKGIEDGKKSLAFSITLQPTKATLTEEEIEAVSKKVVEAVQKATGGSLRA